MNVREAILDAEKVLPGRPAPEGEDDPRWQAIIAVGEHIETNPDEVWEFVKRWGSHENRDLRTAVATCLLEHLLEYHFELLFPRVEQLARSDPMFAWTVSMCSKFGQSEAAANAARLDRLLSETAR